MYSLPRNHSHFLACEIPVLNLDVHNGVRNTCWLIQSNCLQITWKYLNIKSWESTAKSAHTGLKGNSKKKKHGGKEFAKCKMQYFQASSTPIIPLGVFLMVAWQKRPIPQTILKGVQSHCNPETEVPWIIGTKFHPLDGLKYIKKRHSFYSEHSIKSLKPLRYWSGLVSSKEGCWSVTAAFMLITNVIMFVLHNIYIVRMWKIFCYDVISMYIVITS